jgi:uncharacterized protein
LILVDAGPLAALVDADDQHHAACVAALRVMKEPLATVWPPLTEAFFLLGRAPGGQKALWEIITSGAVALLPLDRTDFHRMCELMDRYKDRPMDLADAALIRTAEREGVRQIFTVDQADFSVYRLHGRIRVSLLP